MKGPGMRRYIGFLVYVGATLLIAPLAAADPHDVQENPTAVATQNWSPLSAELSDETAMLLVGTALIGVAAAVHRAA